MEKSPNKDTFCVAPWLSSHISTFDTVIPCCIYKVDEPFGKTREGKPFFEHYNSPQAVKVRKELWEGVKSEGCKECWYREKSDFSYRHSLNGRFSGSFMEEIIENTNDDFTLKEPKFRMLDLRFDNKCNLRCRMCSPAFSSALYKEYKDLGYEVGHEWDSAYHVAVDDNEYQFILDQLQYTKVLFFAGGEPLTQDKFYEILQYCIDNDLAKDIMIWITSNCTKVKYKKYDLINMLNQFKEVELSASIDAYGERADYMRYPAKWDDVESNILSLVSNIKNIRFIAVPTIQLGNIYHIFDLIKYLLTNKICKQGDFHLNILNQPRHLDVRNLPEHHKKKINKLCDDMLVWFDDNTFEPAFNKFKDKQQIELIRQMVNEERNDKYILRFLNYTEAVDKYRGNDFFSSFPELQDLRDRQLVV